VSEINNYIPISRKLFEHQFWCEERVYSRFEAWIDILQSTRFEDTKLLIGNRFIEVKRGQFTVSLRYLAERWKWSTKKVNNFLDLLILAKMIIKETPKETGQTVITVCNYERYNLNFKEWKHQKKQEGNTKETPKKQEGNTKETPKKQEGNKYNNDNKENNNNPPYNPPEWEESESDWKIDFLVYKDELRNAFKKIKKDNDWISQQQAYYPNVDIVKSIEKSCVNYWATEAGWKNKKSKKIKNICWKSTFGNSISKSENKVYYNKNDENAGTQKKVGYV